MTTLFVYKIQRTIFIKVCTKKNVFVRLNAKAKLVKCKQMWQPSQQQITRGSDLTSFQNKSCQVQQLNKKYTLYMFRETQTSGPRAEQRHSFF